MSGQLVKQWPLKSLAEVAEIITGQSPKGEFYNDSGDGLPFYQGKKEFQKKYIGSPTKWTSKTTKIAYEGDILMSVRAPVGPINFATQEICIGRGLAAIRVSEHINRDFLFYQLLFKQDEISGKDGAVFPSINRAMIGEIQVVVPPLKEQQRIVSILDKAFANISETVKQTQNCLFQNNELYEQMLNRIFENSNGGWIEKTLDNICTVKRGSSPRPIKSYFTEDPNGVSWIKIGDTKGVDKYITKTKQKITKEGAERSRLVNKGDLILSNSMSYGKPFIMGISGYIHDGWFVLYVNKEVDSEFLFYALSSRLVQSQFSNLAAGSVVKNISGDLVKKAVIPIPSLSEQKQIVKDIKSMTPSIKLLTYIYNAKLKSLDELNRSILQEAFNGTL